jgi:hypothetical protein
MIARKGGVEDRFFIADGRDDGTVFFHVLNVNLGLFRA